MNIKIVKKNGRWEVNGKPAEEWNYNEQRFMNYFFQELKNQ